MNIDDIFIIIDNNRDIEIGEVRRIIDEYCLKDADKFYLVERFSYRPDSRYKAVINMLVPKIEDIDLKVKAIELLKNEYMKYKLITKLPEEYRIQFINKIDYFYNQIDLLKSIHSEYIKINYLNSVIEKGKCKEEVISLIVTSLENDTLKLRYLRNIKREENKAIVIAGLKSDEIKLRLLSNIRKKRNRTLICCSMRKEENFPKPKNRKNRYSKIGLPSDLTFGIEIESEGKSYKSLYNLGKIINNWKTKDELSLINGVEVVSPVLKDSKEALDQIYIVNESLYEMKQRVNDDCGGHIHIGADYLKSKEAYINLLEIYGCCEKTIYLLSNQCGDILSQKRYFGSCETIAPELYDAIAERKLSKTDEETKEEFIEKLQDVQKYRDKGINFENVGSSEKNTIEFRIPNGTLDPNTWIENIKLFGRLVQVSEELTHEPLEKEEKDKMARKLILKEALKNPKISKNERLEILLELLFEPEERDVYRRRASINYEKMEAVGMYHKAFDPNDEVIINFGKEDYANLAGQQCFEDVKGAYKETGELMR